jgi:hypothetical protein
MTYYLTSMSDYVTDEGIKTNGNIISAALSVLHVWHIHPSIYNVSRECWSLIIFWLSEVSLVTSRRETIALFLT